MHTECVHAPVQEQDDRRPEGDQAVRGRTKQGGVLEVLTLRQCTGLCRETEAGHSTRDV
jgi:hypothetical protein